MKTLPENGGSLGAQVRSDAGVADELRRGKIDFGVCDPIFALQNENKDVDNLSILMPIVKRLDVTALCNANLLDTLEGKVITIACFSSPSTTYAAAKILRDELVQLGAKEVHLKEISSQDKRFNERSNVIKLLDEVEIALLWNPASSWAIDYFASNASGEYGVIYCKWGDIQSRKTMKNWSVVPITTEFFTNDDLMPVKTHKPWVPTRKEASSNKLLAAGVLVREDMSTYRPELNRKIFKALSRALNRISGANWSKEGEYESGTGDKPNLVSLITNHVNNNDGVDTKIIENLVGRKDSMTSIFPFIYSLKSYDPTTYRKHLQNLRDLWSYDTKFSDNFDTPTNKSLASYKSYFVDLKK